jgi:DUF1009 family protein
MAGRPRRLAIVAGGGPLPEKLMAACRAQAREAVVIGIEGQADPDWCRGAAQATVRLGEAGKLVCILRRLAADAVVFAGKVHRPSLRELRPDWRAARFLVGLALRGRLGDDAILAMVESFEREGFRVLAPQDLLGEAAAPGALGRLGPTAAQERDIAVGADAARALGRLDMGHAVVVQDGAVLGVEAADGTDALILRCGALQRSGPGAILVKMAKPQQDRRADPPTIGVGTVERAAAVGFSGIAFEAGRTLVVDPEATAAAADRTGLFLVALPPRS